MKKYSTNAALLRGFFYGITTIIQTFSNILKMKTFMVST